MITDLETVEEVKRFTTGLTASSPTTRDDFTDIVGIESWSDARCVAVILLLKNATPVRHRLSNGSTCSGSGDRQRPDERVSRPPLAPHRLRRPNGAAILFLSMGARTCTSPLSRQSTPDIPKIDIMEQSRGCGG